MLKMLINTIIKDGENTSDPKVRNAYGILCGIYGIVLNVLLFIGKYFAGAVSGSVAIIADAFNNLCDAGGSVITLLGFTLAGKKPDKDHPFGHGRYEYLTGLFIAVLIIITGIELAVSAVKKIIDPQPVECTLLPAMILVISILVKFYMAMYNRGIGKSIGSVAMEANASDSMSDAVATAVVLMSMILSGLLGVNIDGIAGLAVSVFVIYSGISAVRDAISPLLGNIPDKDTVKQINDIVTSHSEVLGIHDLVVHDYGPGRVYVSLHAEVPGSENIFMLHDAIDNAERELNEKLGVNATIHMDPIDTDDNRVAAARTFLTDKLRAEVCSDISIHDVRLVPGPTHTNIVFDAVIPADYDESEDEVIERINSVILSSMPDCYPVVTIDRAMV